MTIFKTGLGLGFNSVAECVPSIHVRPGFDSPALPHPALPEKPFNALTQ